MSITDIDSSRFKKLFSARVAELQEAGETLFETVHKSRSGKSIPVEVHAQVIRFAGKEVVLSKGDRRSQTSREGAKKK